MLISEDALRQLQNKHAADTAQLLAQAQADLQQRHTRTLEERLNLQYHELFTSFAADKVRVMCVYGIILLCIHINVWE